MGPQFGRASNAGREIALITFASSLDVVSECAIREIGSLGSSQFFADEAIIKGPWSDF